MRVVFSSTAVPTELIRFMSPSATGPGKVEASNPCINETDKVIRSPEGDLYRRAGNELGAKMKQNDFALHEGMGTRPTRSWLLSPATKPERFAKAKEL